MTLVLFLAEGYCRRSIKEYLNFLNISLSSLGESVSGLYSYRKAKQISEEQFEKLDSQAYKLENGLLKLVASSERKRDRGGWIDHHFSKLQHSKLQYYLRPRGQHFHVNEVPARQLLTPDT
ncbi:MAG: four helix bundle protein [Desulfobacterales bacterium]